MSLWALFVIAVGLSMDAFAVSICKGLSAGRVSLRHALTCGFWFGGFQALMPLLGWFLGVRFQGVITAVDHWIAFALLCFIGGNMVRESGFWRNGGGESDSCADCGELDASFSPRAMLPLAVATSIDALAVGVTFAFLQVDIAPAVGFIGVVTLVLSAVGAKAGGVFGARWKSGAELFGGAVLILMGCKILWEHLGLMG